MAAGIKSLRFKASHETDFDLKRRASHGDAEAKHELEIRAIIPLQLILQRIDLITLNVIVIVYIANSYEIPQAIALGLVWLAVIYILAATKWVRRRARGLVLRHRGYLAKVAEMLEPALNLIGKSEAFITKRQAGFSSKEELIKTIDDSNGVLTPYEKRELKTILERK